MRQNILNPSKEVGVEGKMKTPAEDDVKIHIEAHDGNTDYENIIDISAGAALMGIGVIFLALIIVIFYLRQK